jgi:hypothetical protein
MVRSKELIALSGITHRQLDHWWHKGWLIPAERRHDVSGIPLEWPDEQASKAILMGRLIRAGISPESANLIACEHMANGGGSYITLGPGIYLTIGPDGVMPAGELSLPGKVLRERLRAASQGQAASQS